MKHKEYAHKPDTCKCACTSEWKQACMVSFRPFSLNLYIKNNPYTGLDRTWGFQDVETPRFHDNRHIKVVRLSALRTGRLYLPGNIPGTRFYQRLSRPQDHSVEGRIMSMKNSNDSIGNRTRNLPACNAVLPRAPSLNSKSGKFSMINQKTLKFLEMVG